MIYDLQKASMMRRIPAWILDVILMITLVTGTMFGMGAILDLDAHNEALNSVYVEYETKYNISFAVSQEEWDKLTAEEKLAYNERIKQAEEEMGQDPKAQAAYNNFVNVWLAMFSVGFLVPHLILEFLVPLLLKNGQTIGKKVFGIALVRQDGIKVTPFMMFVRSILGKYTVETMIPLLLILAALVSILSADLVLWIVLIFLLLQIGMTLITKQKTALHDKLACTVAVDMSSQMIFESVEEMEAYHAEIRDRVASQDN